MAFAQSTLPATGPTAPPRAPLSAPIVPTRQAYDASVTYLQGRLEISAENSSLNQILRDISRVTGMTITGGVADQRVFGHYGPAPPSEILTNLLQGTGTNFMLLNPASNTHAKLILTPQQGGPTPPNLNPPDLYEAPSDLSPAERSRLMVPPPSHRPSRPAYAPPAPVVESPEAALTDTSSDPVTDSPPPDNPQSPNGVQSPQQIYQQLQRLKTAPPQP